MPRKKLARLSSPAIDIPAGPVAAPAPVARETAIPLANTAQAATAPASTGLEHPAA